jgi:dCTP deaminase
MICTIDSCRILDYIHGEWGAPLMMADVEIRAAITDREIVLDPYSADRLEPASYDARVGAWAFSSSLKEKVRLSEKGLLVIEPGEFVVLETLERITLSNRIAGQLGLRSEYAKQGLLMLSGPQIDPTFEGILKVRLINLAPKKIALTYEAPFLTIQFFKLASPVSRPYAGPYQRQEGISGADIQNLVEMEGLTLGQMMKTLSSLATNVSKLEGSVARLSWSIPLIVGFGITVIGIIEAFKR